MKHAWLYNHYAQEPGGPGGTRHYSIGEHLHNMGWSLSIVAASVELNTNRQRLQPLQWKRLDRFSHTNFLWLKTPRYHGNGLGRILNMICYSLLAALPWSTKDLEKPSLIVGSSVHPLAAWAAAIVAKRLRVPFIFEIRDLWPQTLIDLGRISASGIYAKILHALEEWLCKRADKIVVLLPNASEYLTALSVERDKIIWIPNGVDLQSFPSPPPKKTSDQFEFMYFGAHGTANGLSNVLKAMKHVQNTKAHTHIRLRLIGDGPLKPSLIQLARKLDLENVSFEDPVKKSEIPAVASEADAFVFNLVDSPVFKYGISSNKLFDFLAGARPIVFCSNSANNPVSQANAGITVHPEKPEQLAEALIALSMKPKQELDAMGHNGREFVVNNHDYKQITKRFAELFDQTVHPHNTL